MSKEKESAFATPDFYHETVGFCNGFEGLTKLEYFTAAALRGLCANSKFDNCKAPLEGDSELIALAAFKIAKKTLKILGEKK